MRMLIYLLVIAGMISCHPREFSIIRNFEPAGKKKLILDDTYCFYVREVYKESTDDHYSLTNKKEQTDSSHEKLIEIEYILYSSDSNKMLYVTTVPDRDQKYYSEHVMPETQLNARDFNTFHFGKISSGNKADFKTYKKNTYTWQYDVRPDSFLIRRIIETKNGIYQDEFSVENSIYQGAKFRRVKPFEFVYKDNKGDTTLLHMNNRIVYTFKRRKKYFVYLSFDSTIPVRKVDNFLQKKRKDNDFTTIVFKGSNRIPYRPDGIVN